MAGRIASVEGHLAKIAENTGKSAGFLGEIKEDIKPVSYTHLDVYKRQPENRPGA